MKYFKILEVNLKKKLTQMSIVKISAPAFIKNGVMAFYNFSLWEKNDSHIP